MCTVCHVYSDETSKLILKLRDLFYIYCFAEFCFFIERHHVFRELPLV